MSNTLVSLNNDNLPQFLPGAFIGSGLPLAVPQLAAGNQDAAKKNTQLIQTALNTGASVLINGGGSPGNEVIVWCNGNLIYNENPTIEIAANTRLMLMPNLNLGGQPGANIFIPKVYQDVYLLGITNPINSLTYSAGIITATIPNANPYIPAVGDVVSVWNSGWGNFNNITQVLTVTPGGSTTTFTYRAVGNCTIASAPGCREGMQYTKAQRGTKFTGAGIVDGNAANGNDGDTFPFGKCGIVACHMINFEIAGALLLTEFRQRCVFEWQTFGSKIGRYYVTDIAVGYQTNGSVINCVIDGPVSLSNEDDFIAIMDKEAPGFPHVDLCEGDIVNMQVKNINCNNLGGVGSGDTLTCYSFSQLYENSVIIDNVQGEAAGAVYQLNFLGRADITEKTIAAGDIVEVTCLGAGIFNMSFVSNPSTIYSGYVPVAKSGAYTLTRADWTTNGNKTMFVMANAATFTFAAASFVAGDKFAIKQNGASLTWANGGLVVWGFSNIIGKYNSIQVSNFGLTSNQGINAKSIYVGSYQFKNITPRTQTGVVTNQWMVFDSTASYGSLFIDGVDLTQIAGASAGNFLIYDAALNYTAANGFNGGTVEIANVRTSTSGEFVYRGVPGAADRRANVILRSCYALRNSSAPFAVFEANMRIACLQLANVRPHSGSQSVIVKGQVDNTLIIGGAMYCGCLVEYQGAFTYNVVVDSYDISDNDGGNPLLRINNAANTTVINAWVNGLVLGTGVLVTQIAGTTNTFNPKTFGCVLDVTQGFVSKAVGNIATHAKSAGTNQGPAIANGTGFYQQAQGAAVPALCA